MIEYPARPIPIGEDLFVFEEGRFVDESMNVPPTVYYDVVAEDAVVGNFGLEYDYAKRLASINIGLADTALNRGYGIAIYTNIPNLPLPDGESFRDKDFTFSSDRPSQCAQRLWRSLVRRDVAIKCADGTYQLL